MKHIMRNHVEKAAARTTVTKQTAVIEALESSIEDALEREPKLKQCLVIKAARAHLKALKALRAEQVADEAKWKQRRIGQ